MFAFRALSFLLLASLALAPSALAWSVKGAPEPSTRLDASEGWMFASADALPCTSASSPCALGGVYLDGFTSYCAPPYGDGCAQTSLSPNLASLGTGLLAFPTVTTAALGVWKDCNADGYVGLGDAGLFEYRAEVLAEEDALDPAHALAPGTSVCPQGDVPVDVRTGNPPIGWVPVHNDGQWVHEFLPIAPSGSRVAAGTMDANPWDLEVPGARVWADWGRPGEAPEFDCYVATQPRGTYQSTGGLIEWADCLDAGRVTANVDDIATGPLAPLSFADAPDDQSSSGSALNQPNPWGRSTDAPVVRILACDGSLDPRVGASSGSAAGTVHAANDAPQGCHGGADPVADAPYMMERDVVDITTARVRPDHTMSFVEGSRPAPPFSALAGRSSPGDLGARATGLEGVWVSDDVTGVSRDPFVTRSVDAPRGVTWMTYHAWVPPTLLPGTARLPKGSATAKYGTEACGGFVSGVHHGWACASASWWPGDSQPLFGVRVGQPFDLRDVDCYDESTGAARDQGVSWGAVTGDSCG